MSDSQYAPGIYVKGDDERMVRSAADAVALRFEGYYRKPDQDPEPSDVDPVVTPPVPVTSTAAVRDKTPTPRAPQPDLTSQKDAIKP